MAATFEEAIGEIKRRADIGAVIGRSVKLKRSGRSLVGLCPFHGENTPSFYVHPNEGFFKCFGCDAKGDVFSFLERHTGQSFIDIVRNLADEFGVEIPDDRRTPADKRRAQERDHAMRAAELSQLYFRQRLRSDEGKPGLQYLHKVRGLSDDEIDRWAIGYGGTRPGGLMAFLEKEGISNVDAKNAGVIATGRHGDYDFYRSRVTFPIRNRAGKVLAFGGRAMGDRGPKYVNGPQSLIYDKSRDLYGLFEALPELKKGRAGVLVEGYFDVVALGRAGYAAGLSPCGTALTQRHIDTLERYTDRLVLCLDSDSAGMAGTERALLLLLQADMKVSLAELVRKDPDEYVQANEAGVLLRTLEGAKDAFEALVDRAVDRSAGAPQRRLRAVEALLPFLAAPKDALTKSHYLRYVADNLNEDVAILRDAVATRGVKLLAKASRGGPRPSAPARPKPTAPSNANPQRQRPDTQRPDTQRPDTQRPDTQRPDTQRPDTQRPDTQRPDAQRPDAQPPDAKRIDTQRQETQRQETLQQDPRPNSTGAEFLPEITPDDEDALDESVLRESRDFDRGETAPSATKSQPPPTQENGDERGEQPEPPRELPQSPRESPPHEYEHEHDDGVDARPPAPALRAPAKWRTAEKAIARALLCHPHLAHKAAILVPALRNWELARFASQLDHLMIAHPSSSGMDVLRQVEIPPRGVFPALVREIFISRGTADGASFMSEDAALRFIEDFVQTLDEVEVRRALGEVQRAMRNADEREDHDTWKNLQGQQRDLIRLLQDVSVGLDVAPTPPPPTPAALALESPLEHKALPAAARLFGNAPPAERELADSVPVVDAATTIAPTPASIAAQDEDDDDDNPRVLGTTGDRPSPPHSAMEDDLDDEEMFDF